jgi:long-chain acyl-CoA synthetase
MDIDLELFRREVVISTDPLVRLSAIDVAPEHAQRTLVLIHGFGGQALQWIYQLRHFSRRNRVVALDILGHGRADGVPSRFDMDSIVTGIKAGLEYLHVEGKIVLAGHSFGAALAAEYASKYPEDVERLVLTSAVAEHKLNFLYRLGLNLPLPILRIASLFTRRWLAATPMALKRWYIHILSKWNGWSLFRSLSVPTLVIHGARDRVFAKPAFAEVSRSIPGAEEVNVGASGHMVMLERRQAVNRAIDRFLEGGQRSWRDEDIQPPTATRAELVRSRPWLVHYEKGVPDTVAIPRVPLHQFLRSAVRRFPRRQAIYFEGYRLNYRKLNWQANRFANALLSLGLQKGDRVMLLLPNTPQLIIAYFGILKAGGVVVFTLPQSEPEEIVEHLRHSGAKIMVALSELAAVVTPVLAETDLEHVIMTKLADGLPRRKRWLLRLASRGKGVEPAPLTPELGLHSFTEILKGQSRKSPPVSVAPSDSAVIQYTGGTTAASKGVLLSHYNLVANTIQTRHWMPEAKEGRERFLCVLPFSHSYGLTTGLNVPVALGATLIVKARFDVKDTLESIRRQRPSIFPGVPQMYLAISNYPSVRKFGIHSIRACISGSAPLPVEVQESFEKLTRGRLVEGYGLTEASPVTHANPLHGRRKIGSIGIPVPSTEAKIVDLVNPRKEVPAGHIGELVVRGPQVMASYWENPKASAQVLTKDGWLLTGDVAQMDSDGYFRIVARKADMWYPGKPGEPAFPRDVEEVLYEVPQVKEAAVVAIAKKPVAFIIAGKEPPKPDSLIAYCKRRLPPELVPCMVVLVDDFPRTFIGKVLRRELARHYAEHQSEVH